MMDRLVEEFGADISFTFRHFPVITSQSPKAAEAAECAGEQGLFWKYHDYLFDFAGSGQLAVEQLKQYALQVGLAEAEFNSSLDSGEFAGAVRADQNAAFEAGARGTPTFLLNGRQVNFFRYEDAANTIRQLLAQEA